MILVTGASGTVGREVLSEVRKTGKPVLALYRSVEDARSAPPGVNTVIADFADQAALPKALRGVDTVFLVCSPIPELVQLESNMVDACVETGVRHVVLNSALGAGDYDKSFPSWHRKVEDKLKATRLAWTMLRPNSFHQNTVMYFAPSIREQGAYYRSLGNAKLSYLDARDVGAVAAKTLTSDGHIAKVYELNGPEALTSTQVAEKIAKHSGRPVKYVDISMEAQRKAMLEQGLPEWLIAAELDLQQYYANGRGGDVDDVLMGLLGRPPIRLDEYLSENKEAFRSQAAGA
jgi:uncharacterized protein YbjT (DUF2867 family)